MADKNIYPHFLVEPNKKPNRFLAFPLVGFIAKIACLTPVFVEAIFLGIAALILLVINWFVILFTGEYWDVAYRFFVGLMQFSTKTLLYIYGLVDKYPG